MRSRVRPATPIVVAVVWMIGVALATACGRGTAGAPSPSAVASRPPEFRPGQYVPPEIPAQRLADLVAYDRDRPLRVTTRRTTTEPRTGVAITDLTFDDGFGSPVEAFLVAPHPSRTRGLAGVVFAHGAGRDRSRFLEEAKLLARRGALVLLPTVPMNMTLDPAGDVAHLRRTVVTQRRAVDVLAARREVDRRRLGFAGHSWGAVQAAVLAGAEPRLSAIVLASFTKLVSRYYGTSKEYCDQITVFDQHRWLAMPGDRQVLLQAGKLDTYHPASATDSLFAATAAPKERKDYDLNHDLVAPAEPIADRRAFFARVLRLE